MTRFPPKVHSLLAVFRVARAEVGLGESNAIALSSPMFVASVRSSPIKAMLQRLS